jgi:nucleolar protein 14
MRFERERSSQLRRSKKSIFQLGDEQEQLTHRGAALFDGNHSGGALGNASLARHDAPTEEEIREARKAAEAAEEDGHDHRTSQEIFKEVMMKNKLYRAERQERLAHQRDMLGDIDDEFKDIQTMVEFKNDDDKDIEMRTADPSAHEYNRFIMELSTDARAVATERLKTNEELAAQQRATLERLEAARKLRMQGVDPDADDDDEKSRKRRKTDSMAATDDDLVANYEIDPEFAPAESDYDDSDVEDASDDDNYASSYVSKKARKDKKRSSRLYNDTAQAHLVKKKLTEAEQKRAAEAAADGEKAIPFTFNAPETVEQLEEWFSGHTADEQMQIIRRIWVCNHPSFGPPQRKAMSHFFDLLLQYVLKICQVPESGKIEDIDGAYVMDFLEIVTVVIFDLSQALPREVGDVARAHVQQMRARMASNVRAAQVDRSLSGLPAMGDIVVLQILGMIFPTSDLRHNVTVPAMLLMSECLARMPVQGPRDVAAGMYMTTLLLAYVAQSERFVPEIPAFLYTTIHAIFGTQLNSQADDEKSSRKKASKNKTSSASSHMLRESETFLPLFQFSEHTFIGKYLTKEQFDGKLKSKKDIAKDRLPFQLLFARKQTGDEAPQQFSSSDGALQLAASVCSCIISSMNVLSTLPSMPEVFEPIKVALQAACDAYEWAEPAADMLKDTLDQVTKCIAQKIDLRKPLVRDLQVKSLRMATPIFVEGYAPNKDLDPDKLRAERRAMKRAIHTEKRAATRELRRDADFLAREQQKATAALDAERAAKTKRVMGLLQEEAHGMNAMAAIKRKKNNRR